MGLSARKDGVPIIIEVNGVERYGALTLGGRVPQRATLHQSDEHPAPNEELSLLPEERSVMMWLPQYARRGHLSRSTPSRTGGAAANVFDGCLYNAEHAACFVRRGRREALGPVRHPLLRC